MRDVQKLMATAVAVRRLISDQFRWARIMNQAGAAGQLGRLRYELDNLVSGRSTSLATAGSALAPVLTGLLTRRRDGGTRRSSGMARKLLLLGVVASLGGAVAWWRGRSRTG
jgi:hypothetical protein